MEHTSSKAADLNGAIGSCGKPTLSEVTGMYNLVREYFDGDRAQTALWFRTPNPMLGYISPRDMIRSGRHGRLQKFILNACSGNAVRVEDETVTI